MTRQELIMSHVSLNCSVERCNEGRLQPVCMLKARSIWKQNSEIALRVCKYFCDSRLSLLHAAY